MTDKSSEYADRLSDLLDDMESDGVDSVNMMMSWIAGYVEGVTGDSPDTEFFWQFEDKSIVIGFEDGLHEGTIVRLH
ncbi:hypothetical protein EH228_04545 [Erwinia endophytica]|uniref:hypothetical protein n=1 Tax=Erwinia endophytica TaxID=1563158 RepID=UPI001265E11D|nr:hypothetical protein [Erwinia endophytica]KAB8312951.1 hypothetical protein EH228_04545 [Erwinia endophytica]